MASETTRIVLIRHGEAEPAFDDDKSRSLTERGHKQVLLASKQINQYLEPVKSFDCALVSPYVRTQQTFDVLTINVRVKQKFTSAVMTPMSSVADAQREIFDRLQHSNSLLVVTHMPLVSFLTSELCFLDSPPLFMTSSFAVIDVNKGEGTTELIDLIHQHD